LDAVIASDTVARPPMRVTDTPQAKVECREQRNRP
jgi:hypothetical protein